MSKEKMMRFYFISDEDAKEYMEKNHINGSSSQYNVKIYPDYSKEHVTYYNREDLVMSIVEKVNNNEITKFCEQKSIWRNRKEKSNKDSNIIYELIIPKKLLNDRGNYLNDKILDLDSVTSTTIEKYNNKKLSKFLAVITGAAAAIGTIGGIMYGMKKVADRLNSTQDNRNAYEQYYEGIMPEYKFNELAGKLNTNPTETTKETTYYYDEDTNEFIQTTEENTKSKSR